MGTTHHRHEEHRTHESNATRQETTIAGSQGQEHRHRRNASQVSGSIFYKLALSPCHERHQPAKDDGSQPIAKELLQELSHEHSDASWFAQGLPSQVALIIEGRPLLHIVEVVTSGRMADTAHYEPYRHPYHNINFHYLTIT